MPFRQLSEDGLRARLAELEPEVAALRSRVDGSVREEALHEERKARLAEVRKRAVDLHAEIARIEAAASLVRVERRGSYGGLARPTELLAASPRPQDSHRTRDGIARALLAGVLLFASLVVLTMPVEWAAAMAGFPTLLLAAHLAGWRGEGL